MSRFLVRRLLHGIFVVWGVVTAVFFLVRLTGDPAAFLVDQSATSEAIAHTRRLLGLGRPVTEQYLAFLLSVAKRAARSAAGVPGRPASSGHGRAGVGVGSSAPPLGGAARFRRRDAQ